MRCRRRFSQQSGSGKRYRDERSENSDDCVHGGPVQTLQCLAAGMNRRGKCIAAAENCLPARGTACQREGWFIARVVIGQLQRLLLDEHRVCY